MEEILKVEERIKDKGRIKKWRLIIYRGDKRRKVGEYIVKREEEREGKI